MNVIVEKSKFELGEVRKTSLVHGKTSLVLGKTSSVQRKTISVQNF